MIEPFPQKPVCSSQKRGFALLITLSVLTVVIALTAVMMGYMDIARKEAVNTKALIQANLYYANTKKLLKSKRNKRAFYSMLYQLPVSLRSDDGRFMIHLKCHPLDNGININWLGEGNNEQTKIQYTTARKVFDTLVQSYNIADPTLLEEILLQAIRGKTEYGEDDEQSRIHQKNGIISYQQFAQLIERYEFEADDPKVERIRWQDYFVFTPAKSGKTYHKIAGDYLSIALISILFDIDRVSIREAWESSQGGLKSLLSQFAIAYDSNLFTSKFTGRSECEVRYQYQSEPYRFTFRDSEGEVKDFAFYGK